MLSTFPTAGRARARLVRHAASASLAVVLSCGLAAPALAHAHLRTADPAPDSTVQAAPAQVTINFTEGVEPRFSSIEVRDSSGKRVDRNDAHVAPNDNKRFSVGLPAISPGTYKVIWHATAVDTHKTEGTFQFTVRQ